MMICDREPTAQLYTTAGDPAHRLGRAPSVIGTTDVSSNRSYGCLVMVLQIVVTPECFGCDEASRLAALMRREFPMLEVELHIVTGTARVPPGVVATPTYLLDGQPVVLGNPRADVLAAQVARRLRPTT